jgi:hypothetical protein
VPKAKGVWKSEEVALISTVAAAVPNTSLALVTELFGDRKSPLAAKGREGIKWYVPEAKKLAIARCGTR